MNKLCSTNLSPIPYRNTTPLCLPPDCPNCHPNYTDFLNYNPQLRTSGPTLVILMVFQLSVSSPGSMESSFWALESGRLKAVFILASKLNHSSSMPLTFHHGIKVHVLKGIFILKCFKHPFLIYQEITYPFSAFLFKESCSFRSVWCSSYAFRSLKRKKNKILWDV